MRNAINSYQKIQVNTSSPLQNIITLYEQCLRHLERLRKHITEKDLAKKHTALQKSMDIIIALDSNLDMTMGEIPKSLHSVYQILLSHLTQANIKNDVKPVELAEELLTELLDTWKDIQKRQKV